MYKKTIALVALLFLVLSACGTADKQDAAESNDSGNISQQENNAITPPAEPPLDENADEAEEEIAENTKERTIDYQVNGVAKSDVAIAEHNDNQNYTMHVLPGYTLTAEEPNNDIVFVTDAPEVFMRIQLLPADVDWDATVENATEQLKAVNEDVDTLAPSDAPFLNDAVMMETSIGEEFVASYLIKNHSVPLRLLLFTQSEADHTDAFLKMAETIVQDD